MALNDLSVNTYMPAGELIKYPYLVLSFSCFKVECQSLRAYEK